MYDNQNKKVEEVSQTRNKTSDRSRNVQFGNLKRLGLGFHVKFYTLTVFEV